jgi:exopolysaccharide production protein ExoZ
VRIGDASYAIYLTHIIVLGLVGIAFTRLGIGGLTSSVTSATAVVLATLVGILVHEKVDKPIQRKIAKKR